jgi:rubrerythrin
VICTAIQFFFGQQANALISWSFDDKTFEIPKEEVMIEKLNIQDALRAAIFTEKEAMDFYKSAAEQSEEKPKEVFELLAREERQHAQMFYNVYTGQDLPRFDDLMASPPDTESTWWKALQQAMVITFDERKALQLAIEQEEILEQKLRETAAAIDDPVVKAIYIANANSTHHHLELIEEQYKDYLGMSY